MRGLRSADPVARPVRDARLPRSGPAQPAAATTALRLNPSAARRRQHVPSSRVARPWSTFALRAILLTLVVAVATLHGQLAESTPWVAALTVVLAASALPRPRDFEAALIVVELTVAAGGAVATGGASSPLLVYLPAATLVAGRTYGLRATFLSTGWAVALLALGRTISPDSTGTGASYASACAQYVIFALVVGVLASWTRPSSADQDLRHYAEANRVLEHLQTLTRDLPGGLDPGTVADLLLDRLGKRCSSLRSAVLVRAGASQLAPVSYRGMSRVPWRDPAVTPGPLRTCLLTARPVLDMRTSGGRRGGSALLALPLTVSGRVLGLAVVESRDLDAFTPALVDELAGIAAGHALALDTALLFDELRSTASLEERERLAREMHDGVAQDLAMLGYQVDALRRRLPQDAAAHGQTVRLRSALDDLITDLRVSITDLRTSTRGERGLGPVLTSYLRNVGSKAGLTVHLSLSESTFRLPGEVEVALFRLAQDVVAGVRRHVSAANLWLELEVDPPAALMAIEHDGAREAMDGLDADVLARRADAIGATVRVMDRRPGSWRIEVEIRGDES